MIAKCVYVNYNILRLKWLWLNEKRNRESTSDRVKGKNEILNEYMALLSSCYLLINNSVDCSVFKYFSFSIRSASTSRIKSKFMQVLSLFSCETNRTKTNVTTTWIKWVFFFNKIKKGKFLGRKLMQPKVFSFSIFFSSQI